MEEKTDKAAAKLIEQLYTPKELDEKKILSLVQQWKERNRGRLQCYRIGRKIFYGEHHLAAFFAQCEGKDDLRKNGRR